MFHGMCSFDAHIAVFVGLLSLTAGYWLLHQAAADTCCPKWFVKFLGALIMLVSFLGLLCIGYMTIQKTCKRKPMDFHHGMPGMQMEESEAPAMPNK